MHLGILGNAIGMLAGCHGYRAVKFLKSNSLDRSVCAHTHTHVHILASFPGTQTSEPLPDMHCS